MDQQLKIAAALFVASALIFAHMPEAMAQGHVVVIAAGGYIGGVVGPTLHELESASSP